MVIPGLLRSASQGSLVSWIGRDSGFWDLLSVKRVALPVWLFKLFLGLKRKKAVENGSEYFPTMIKYSEKVDS